MYLFAVKASLAIGLAILGTYAVLSHFAMQQRGQIALRMALGADSARVRRWVVWRGWSKCLLGAAIGVPASYPFCRLLSGQLFGLEPDNAPARIAGAVVVLGTTLLATWLPAARASRIEPNEALKSL